MRVHFIRSGTRRYSVRVEREGAPALVMDPAPGFDSDMPHDMVHFVAEAALGLTGGVFGQLAAGGTAGSFRLDTAAGGAARDHRRLARKTAQRGQKLVEAQGREGDLSELAALLFDIGWRSRTPGEDPRRQAARAEAARARATLSPAERERFDAAQPRVFAAFDELSAAWRRLGVGAALILEWPTLRRVTHPIG